MKRFGICSLTMGAILLFILTLMPQQSFADTITAPALQPGWSDRDRLTGDWGGARTKLEKAGVKLDLELTQFYQGLVSGTGPHNFEYGGRLDGFLKLDTEAMGLWKGGGLRIHLEYRYGDLPGSQTRTFFPVNSGMEFPGDSPNTLVATSFYLTQQFGEHVSFLVGKINALDTVENDPFFGGWGNHRFMNTVFVAPPSGLVPPVFYGAIANVSLDPVTVSLWVYDPADRTQDDWPDDLFDNGVTCYLSTTYATKLAGRPTTFSLNGIYTTKTGIEFGSIADVTIGDAVKGGVAASTKEGSYSIGFQFSHLLHLNRGNPGKGWGLFLKSSMSDGNPNYVQKAIIAGIGGKGLFRGRELDSFGVGYFYYDLSNDLQDSLDRNRQGEKFGDEQGFEAYYSYAVTPWLYIAGDLQVIDPPRKTMKNPVIAGLRTMIRF